MSMSVKIDIEKAAAMWSEGVTIEHIAARVGFPKDKVRHFIRRNRDIFPERARRNSWTPEQLGEASKMWKAGQTASVIGERFGIDRKTVCRLAFDHRDLFPMRTRGAMLANRKPSTPKQRQANVHREAAEFIAEIEAEIPPSAFDAGRVPHAKTLVDLQRGECKWPLNHGGPFLFCAETTGGGNYCSHHSAR